MNYKVLIVLFISCFAGALCHDLCIDSCPLNEVFSECKGGGTCQMTCSTRNVTIGECYCESGCICKTGFIRDANIYKCIRISSCPPIDSATCARNEVYSVSGAGCQKNCYTQNRQYKCIPKSGCICKSGYIRSPITNQCILITSCDKCPSGYYLDSKSKRCELICDICRDSKAEFKACGDRCRELTCENPLLEGIVFPEFRDCEPGCFCKAGYIKDPKTKLCIRPTSCPNPCKDINAEYSNCGTNNTCDMKTCRFPFGQGDDCMRTCQKGCFCKPGYVKNDSGKCVRPRNCPILKCKKNEIFECRNPTCEAGCTIEPCMSVNCENKCYCRDGYVKQNGTCILLETCKKCEDPNASYSNCKSGCTIATCLNPSGVNPFCQDEICGFGCFCKKGYVADHTGKCILPNKCPKCPANESFSCGSAACEKSCGNINDICDIVNIKCDDKCFCNEGFVRETPNGPCIPIETCPVPSCEDPNAEHKECGSSCSDGTCVNPQGISFNCPEMCETGCFCKTGFVKNEEGTCVLPETCPIPKCPLNEEYTCKNANCESGCRQFACLYAPCTNKCYCVSGFVRENGVCIPREKCKETCSDPNSSFRSCGTSCEPTCDKPNPMICPKICVAGCFCNAGFIKDSTGVCIPIDKCPKPKDCPANEVFDCRHPTCGERGCFWLCRPAPGTPCQNRCFCADGYRRINGICILEEKCPKEMITCNADETFECREPVCTGLDCFMTERPPKDTVPSCEYKCYCAAGLVNIDGKCVPDSKCPMPNTEYRTCVNPCTEPSCANPTTALIKCAYACVDGCFCREGYYKNDDGACIELDQCPKTCPETCPANESCSCQIADCERSCETRRYPCDPANPYCANKCYCNSGFIRSGKAGGACVPYNQCGPIWEDLVIAEM